MRRHVTVGPLARSVGLAYEGSFCRGFLVWVCQKYEYSLRKHRYAHSDQKHPVPVGPVWSASLSFASIYSTALF